MTGNVMMKFGGGRVRVIAIFSCSSRHFLAPGDAAADMALEIAIDFDRRVTSMADEEAFIAPMSSPLRYRHAIQSSFTHADPSAIIAA